MTKRLPIAATIVVAPAVAAMLALGVWQLRRLDEKQAALATYRANLGKAVAALPRPAIGDEWWFRRVSAYCLTPFAWTTQNGRGRDNRPGYRHIAECRTGAEGPSLFVDTGIGPDPKARPAWRGGEVTGTLTRAPDPTPIIVRAFGGGGAPSPMIVAETPAPGLAPSKQPDPATVPNNHLAYAVTWFVFAGLAALIYALALRRRASGTVPPAPSLGP